MNDVTHENLLASLSYDPETGIFIRKRIKGTKEYLVGEPAGRLHKVRGYREIHICGKLYYAHRLAWLYMTGEWPSGVIDHINHDKGDNRWSNLRDVDLVINGQNRKGPDSDNTLGALGVSHNGSGFRARIFECGKEIHLGTFKTIDEAVAVRAEAVKKYRPYIKESDHECERSV